MRVLLVESDPGLTDVWAAHLRRGGADVFIASCPDSATAVLQSRKIDVMILDLDLDGALAIANFSEYRQPEAAVILVTRSNFFSDGSIFRLLPNARGFLAAATPPGDLAALAVHCAAR